MALTMCNTYCLVVKIRTLVKVSKRTFDKLHHSRSYLGRANQVINLKLDEIEYQISRY
jgi:hypothetical protein